MPFSSFQSLPINTAQAAKSVFNIENLYLAMGDQLDLFLDLNLADLDAFGEKPTSVLFLLAMVTLFQFAEGLPDRQAADAVRTRLDWKYALHLPMDYPGLDHSALSEFRQRLRCNTAGHATFQRLLTQVAAFGLLGNGDKRQAEVVDVLAAVDALGRAQAAKERTSRALEALAAAHPSWLRAASLPHWYGRYDQTFSAQAPSICPEELDALARAIEADIRHLLQAIEGSDIPYLALLPEVQALQRTRHKHIKPHDSEDCSHSRR